MTARRESNCLNITSYNIRGLEGKQKDNEFIKYLRNFDIFILLETHTLPDALSADEFKQNQTDFEFLHWKDATKVFRRGRGIGGCIIGIRKSLKDSEITHLIVERENLKILQLRLGDKVLNIVPLYLHTIGWEEEFEPVRKAFDSKEVPIENAIVLGDVNIRIGEIKQAVKPNPCVANTNGRLSKDKKWERGGKFLTFCTDNQLQILNGLTNGDPEGSFTYFSTVGNSTIDIAAVSQNLMASVVDFKVDKPSVAHGSDHLPICLEMNLDLLGHSQVAITSPMRGTTSGVSFDSSIVLSESSLDSAITSKEVAFVLRHGSWPEFSGSTLKDFVGDITHHCNTLFTGPITKKIVASIVSKVSSAELKRILLNILKVRLTRWCRENQILSNSQIRFSGKSSKKDFVYNLSSIASIKLAEKGTRVYSYFVQFESVSSEMLKTLLWAKLQKLGVSSKIITFLSYILREKLYRDKFLNYFQNGGGALSKLIFALYLNDLPEKLKEGLLIDDRQISILMYADKIVIIADSPNALQAMINQLEKYCIKWGMMVDMTESKVMVFRRGGRISAVEKWIMEGEEIETTSKAMFLDFQFTASLSSRQQVLKMVADAKGRLEDFLGEHETWTRLLYIYMAEVWGIQKFKEIGKLQASFVKKSTDTTTSSRPKLHSLALDLHLKYIGKLYFSDNDNSLARFLTHKVIEENILWAEKLSTLCGPFKLKWKSYLTSELEWTSFCSNLVSRLKE